MITGGPAIDMVWLATLGRTLLPIGCPRIVGIVNGVIRVVEVEDLSLAITLCTKDYRRYCRSA